MPFIAKEITLKDGRTAVFRSPKPEDSEALLKYMKATAGETPYLLRTPEECTMTAEAEQAFITNVNNQKHAVMILCFLEGNLAGTCQIVRHTRQKSQHRASVMIALYQKFWGLGIGTAMFQEMITPAKDWEVQQLELEVIEGNVRAIALYEKMGFTTVATLPDAIRLNDGTFLKEYTMVRNIYANTLEESL